MLFSARALIYELLYEFCIEYMWLAALSAHNLLVFLPRLIRLHLCCIFIV